MVEKWVVNASPIILLAKVKLTDLLFLLADEIVIPNLVVDEIMAGPDNDPGRVWLSENASRLEFKSPALPAQLLAWDLGAGETSVMAYALANPGWTVILDDYSARKCALSFGIPVKGTLALIILARQKGLITSAANALRALQAHNFYINETIIRNALANTIGEEW